MPAEPEQFDLCTQHCNEEWDTRQCIFAEDLDLKDFLSSPGTWEKKENANSK